MRGNSGCGVKSRVEKPSRKENDSLMEKGRRPRAERRGRWQFTPVKCGMGSALSIIDGADHVINGQVEQKELEHLL